MEQADLAKLQRKENTALTMLKKPVNWGIEDSSENIDKYVYGSLIPV